MKPLIVCLAFCAFAISAFAQTPSAPPISQLFAFYCNSDYSFCPYGFQPALGPVQLADGNFYGTTWYGSTSTGLGTVWQATTSGEVNTLYTFEPNGSGEYLNGSLPALSFVAGPDGKLYGVTVEGGSQGDGVFYSITTTGTQQVLYNFCSLAGCPDQAFPVVLAGDGNFYGINAGGTTSFVFRLTPEGAWSQFYNFPSGQLGEELVAGTDGNLYGVEAPLSFTKFKESVFRLSTAGEYTVLRTFPKLDRVNALVQSASGTVYGVSCCDTNTGVFEITSAGKYKMLQKTPESALPPSLLVPGSDGNLYGLIADGANYDGQVFGIATKKKNSFTESLNCDSDGCVPLSMIEASDGNFYGLTAKGGSVSPGDNPNGTIFKVATGLKEH